MKTKPLLTLAILLLAASPLMSQNQPDPHDDPHADPHAHDPHAGHGDEVRLSESAIRISGIQVETATRRNLTASFVVPARVAFDGEAIAHVGTPVPGRVVQFKVRQGDAVKKGDALMIIESPELGRSQSAYLQRRTEAEIAAAAVAPAKDAYDRAKTLFDQSQGIAHAEVLKREAELRVAFGTEATAAAQLRSAENELRLLGLTATDIKRLTETKAIEPEFEIRSPIHGQLIERNVTLGEYVTPEKEAMVVIADTSHVWVIAAVPEGRLPDVAVGSLAEVHVATSALRVKGEVSFLAPEVDSNSRTLSVRIHVPNPDGRLKPGMFAQAMLSPAEAGASVVAIPEEALHTIEGRPAVFVPVAGEPNTFAARPVGVGRAIHGFVPVISGIEEGERLVTRGAFILKAELGKGAAHHTH